jgi:uncharacterized Zn-finger protein
MMEKALPNENTIPANARRQYLVTLADVPLCCPMPEMVLWNSHPRVYLPIEKTGTATCPYCGAEYFLSENSRIE